MWLFYILKFCVISGILKRKVKLFDKTFYADIVKTEEEKREVFEIFHNSNIGGHGGTSKTRNKIAEKYYWPGLSKDVENWVSLSLVIAQCLVHMANIFPSFLFIFPLFISQAFRLYREHI